MSESSDRFYLMLADGIVLVHLSFILFAIFGGLLTFRWRWIPWLHVPALVWGVVLEFAGWICPLTPLENALRTEGGSAGYSGDFVVRYLLPVIYPEDLTIQVQWLLGFALLAFNLIVYLSVWRYRLKRI